MARHRLLRRLLGPKLTLTGPLHVGESCGGDFVNPASGPPAATGSRRVTLRCGACGHVRHTAVAPTSAVLLEAAHGNRLAQLAELADQLERERLSGWVESFSGALERDLIDAGDFR